MLINELFESVLNSKSTLWDKIRDTDNSYREWWIGEDYENNYQEICEKLKTKNYSSSEIISIRNDIRFLYHYISDDNLKEKLDILIDIADNL